MRCVAKPNHSHAIDRGNKVIAVRALNTRKFTQLYGLHASRSKYRKLAQVGLELNCICMLLFLFLFFLRANGEIINR